jgi:hypothetical protein
LLVKPKAGRSDEGFDNPRDQGKEKKPKKHWPNAGPHVGGKKKHEPSFSGKKTKNLRFRVFFLTLRATTGSTTGGGGGGGGGSPRA